TVIRDIVEPKPSPEDISSPSRLDGVVVGVLAGLTPDGSPLVDFPGNPGDNPILARAPSVLGQEEGGRQVALRFEKADPTKPVLVGVIAVHRGRELSSVVVRQNAERIELVADREIVLRCGKASITLTRAGKILIRGAYVSSRSSGVNTIKGGSV